MSDYKPVNCDYYDHLEDWATRKEKISISYKGDKEGTADGVIKDLYVREHQEYLVLDNGTEIRLDTIREINGQSVRELSKS